MQAAAGEVEKQFPAGIDHLINNAGILSDHVTHLNMCVCLTSCLMVQKEVSSAGTVTLYTENASRSAAGASGNHTVPTDR